ncbi:MAG TPA: hypothetical protein PLE45_11235 [Spirochaetota bacterium]|nr:hypothetical protein [Spirochaetota bacterium]HPP05395.1 hypothetical protein [Spirochaetota bacterium]
MSYKIKVLLLFLFLSSCALMFYNNNQFDVYESEHFTFFYLRGTECGNKIKEIADGSEFAIKIAEIIMAYKIDLKIDAYLYDDGSQIAYSKFLPSLTGDATFQFRDGFQVVYNTFKEDFFLYISTILHETIHFFQTSILKLNNYGIIEGHAFYIQLKYYYYVKYNNISDDYILSELKYLIYERVVKDKELPHKIFSLTGKEFQNINITLEDMTRDAKNRYEIGANFIAFLNKKYGTQKLMKWLENLNDNFIEKFKEVYGIDFYTVENLWLTEIIYE